MPTLDHVGRGTLLGTSTLARTRRRSYVYPLIASALLAGVAVWANRELEASMQRETRDGLQAVLDADVKALQLWLDAHADTTRFLAADPRVQSEADQLFRLGDAPGTLVRAAAQKKIRALVQPYLDIHGFAGFGIIDRNGIIVASPRDDMVGMRAEVLHGDYIRRVLAGETVLAPPADRARVGDGSERPEFRHTLVIAAPLPAPGGGVAGVIGFLVDAREFAEILQTARAGETGETYAFNAEGKMVSRSRFDDHLKEIGLLPDEPGTTAVLTVEVRDPGGNLVDGYRTDVPRRAQPLTRMAASAIAGESGSDVDGYRDYRGVEVVGAWTWLPAYDFGVATEMDEAEAYRTLHMLRGVFWTLTGLLLVGAAALFVGSRVIFRLQSKVSEAQQLGQYTLKRKIGEGAMGQVYEASHSMLRRPTAIKILSPEGITEEKLARFAREVQLTAALTHPNTIAIYDYGRSADGIFYYAMEYLDGVTLDQLVKEEGPLPPALVVHLLRQACGSLAEAHDAGLIHRDIKPANIMVCRRAGLWDMVKVLDFGLVKDVVTAGAPEFTMVGKIVGTPHYMAPEALRDPQGIDARADLYALGAVGYYLLCGKPTFLAASVVDIVNAHLTQDPEPPSSRLDRSLPADLEAVILRCLEKEPEKRPPSARELERALAATEAAGGWDEEVSEAWWSAREPRAAAPEQPPTHSRFSGRADG